MLTFIKSPRLDRIYYADLFRINGKACVILGYGKSTAARLAADKVDANDLARDSVAIDEINGSLHAGYDPGGYGAYRDPNSTRHTMHPVSMIIYCLDPVQTTSMVTGNSLIKCAPAQMAQLSVTYPYPASIAPYVCTPAELGMYSSNNNRVKVLEDLLSRTEFSNTYLMPFTDTVEGKAQIYRQHV
ncbi:hypothetical protein L1889_06615 [Paenalcaligenes niemegkensis]|uniref:hypothetical protein n=1 Tax=Paenalcaligenes niemegkensis TaxID=2895469 RepID=UPI001EE7B4AD|nr:hypothetical protein [Paenalcaligenes niemegkensis]MCQ9616418.1 hypothetical protein [Paenalcaligenes niemegkensis]